MILRATTGWLLVLVVALAACSPAGREDPATVQTPDPALTAEVAATFATYRSGVAQGDADAVLDALDAASVEDMARIAGLAADVDEEVLRELPAAEQLLVLTYRLRPDLLAADDPYAALVAGGFGGQDRSLGDLGEVTPAGEGLALGVIIDAQARTPTPLRWRFTLEDGSWRFDLVDAHRLLSQAIASSARRSGVGVDQLVTATVVDLSGEDAATVEALYTEPPAG